MIASIHAYMDESVDKQERLFVVGGFVSRPEAWSSILHQWIDRIQPDKLPNPIKAFHMTDCETGQGEFRDKLGWNQGTRRQLIIDLINIICGHVVGLFAVGLPIAEYKALDPITPDGTRLGYSQYHFIFQAAIAYLAGEFEDSGFPHHETIAFFFDRNSPYESWANKLHAELKKSTHPWSHRIGSLTFEGKERMRLLQVADLGVYEGMKYLTNSIYNEGRTRKSFEKLAAHHCVMKLSAFSEDNLHEMVKFKKETLGELIMRSKTKGSIV
ncbi:MAG: DUF3800 domain-containing protein [Terriglobales bacterium]